MNEEESQLTQLGNKVDIPNSPDEAILERIPVSGEVNRRSVVQFSCPEFTSLCPQTKQPDFARFYIQYIPANWLVESKSLKLFLHSFRNIGIFHENCTGMIFSRLLERLDPQWLRISGIWFARGGLALDIFIQTGAPPQWAHIPQLKMYPYVGR